MRLFTLALFVLLNACGPPRSVVTAGALVEDPTRYDGAEIVLAGIVENPRRSAGYTSFTLVEGTPDSGVICVNGAAAHLVSPGDLVIIAAYTWLDEDAARVYEPKVVFVDERNRMREKRAEVPGPERAVG